MNPEPAPNLLISDLLYPTFAHFRSDVHKATKPDDLNRLIGWLRKADKKQRGIHAFTEDEIKHAWNSIRKKGRELGLSQYNSDGTYYKSKTTDV